MINIGIAMALVGMQMLTNKKLIAATKKLVEDIDKRDDLENIQKHNYVVKQVSNYIVNDFLAATIDVVIKLLVMQMQAKDGRLQQKMKRTRV